MRSILLAVAHIHSLGIVHRDLKPGKHIKLSINSMSDNILVGDINDFNTIKLADFGLSAKY
jgi:serine/threonine protein kinase